MSNDTIIGKPSKIFEALIKAQSEFPVIPKDSKVEVRDNNGNLKYKYKYADLTTIVDSTRPHLTNNGLGFTQSFGVFEGMTGIYTTLIHSSGESLILGFCPCEIKNQDMKFVAGQFTYGKRISLSAALGISPDEDMDAAPMEAKEGNNTTKPEAKPKFVPSPGVVKLDPKTIDDYIPPQEPPPITPRMRLIAAVKQFNVPFEDMPEVIYRCTGDPTLTSNDLDDEQVQVIIDYFEFVKV